MTNAPFTAITSPPRQPTLADHALGFVVAIVTTIVGAVLTPFLALAFVAAQPILVVGAFLRAHEEDAAIAAAAAGRRAA